MAEEAKTNGQNAQINRNKKALVALSERVERMERLLKGLFSSDDNERTGSMDGFTRLSMFLLLSLACAFGTLAMAAEDETVLQVAGEGRDAVLTIKSDEGDDTDDELQFIMNTDNDLSITIGGDEVLNITKDGAATFTSFSAGSTNYSGNVTLENTEVIDNSVDNTVKFSTDDTTLTLTVEGGEDGDAVLILDADQGDDTEDTWTFESEATGNDLSVLNGSTEVLNLTSAGALSVDSTFTAGGAITAGGAFLAAGQDLGSTAAEFDDLFLNDAGKIQLGNDQDVTITHVADAGILMELDDYISFGDSAVFIESDDDGYLDLDADTGIRANATLFLDGGLLDATGAVDMDYGSADITDHTLTSDGGTVIIDGSITALGEDLGSTSAEWNDLFLNDGGKIQLGADQDVTLTHVADTGIQVELDDSIMFGDTAVFIESDDNGYLDLDADTGIRLNSTLVAVQDTLTIGQSIDTGAANVLDVGSVNATEVNLGAEDISVEIVGGLKVDYVAKTANYTNALTDHIITYNTSAATTNTLPEASTALNRVFTIALHQDGGDLVVVTDGTDTFDGTGSSEKITMEDAGDCVTVVATGANSYTVIGNTGGTLASLD